jgi:phospholipid transport system transporter-binding protein
MSEQLFKPSHELTFDTVQQDSKRLLTLLQDNKTTSMRLDLSEVVQCDSAGLALLIEAKRLCKQYKKTLTIDIMPKAISALAEFCGVEVMLES